MRKNPDYALRTLSGVPFLLPFGQAIADQRRGVQLGGSGPLLWSMLDRYSDSETLIDAFLDRLEVDGPQREKARADAARFLSELRALGLLEPEGLPVQTDRVPAFARLRVGPLGVLLRGAAEWFHDDFAPFLSPAEDPGPVHQTVTVIQAPSPGCAGLRCLLQNDQLEVFKGPDRLLLRFPSMPGIAGAVLTPEGDRAVFHLCGRDGGDRQDLFHAIRHAVLYRAQRQGLFALHAASVLYRSRVWLFSAPSGTGKSTHAALWQDRFGTPVLNGDLALLSAGEDGAVFHPLPWCGTSGITVEETHPLGGVIFLRQARGNSAVLLPEADRQLRLTNRLISPIWTEEQLVESLSFAGRLAGQVGMWQLDCTPDPAAADCMKDAVDRFLEDAGGGGSGRAR